MANWIEEEWQTLEMAGLEAVLQGLNQAVLKEIKLSEKANVEPDSARELSKARDHLEAGIKAIKKRSNPHGTISTK